MIPDGYLDFQTEKKLQVGELSIKKPVGAVRRLSPLSICLGFGLGM